MNPIRAVGYACCAAIVVLILAMMLAGPVPAMDTAACSVTRAKQADVRAAAKAREAHRVYLATVKYTELYGHNVGRWVRPARLAGWRWVDMPTLMLVIHTESRGDPNAWTGYYAGLVQIGKLHAAKFREITGRPYFNGVFIGFLNLKFGRFLWRGGGWKPWPWLATG